MKTTTMLVATLLIGGLATTSNATAAQNPGPENAVPTAIEVYAPIITRNQVGEQVRMTLIVNERGFPKNISSERALPKCANLAASMKVVLRYWRFQPARDQFGRPISVKVAIPVKVVKSDDDNTRLVASLELAEN